MLSDKDIKDKISEGSIVIEPYEEQICLTPVGYDLRVGNKGFSWNRLEIIAIEENGRLTLDPGDTVVIETLEALQLSKSIGGTIHSVATHTLRRGLSHISTTVDPGWTGKLLISVHNHLSIPVDLDYQDRFCTICLYGMLSRAEKDVNSPPGRTDIWNEIRDRARDVQRMRELQDKDEESRRLKQEKADKNRRILIIMVFIFVLLLAGVYGYIWLDPSSANTLYMVVVAVVALLPQIFPNFLKLG
ncbi:MAG: hypothetical protein VKK04_24305 [Synechococcales bacterium]|nr:hypothetical protein [Synechococcales bacterium]